MKQVSISKLKQMSGEDIKDSPCFEIVCDDQAIAIVITSAVENMNDTIKALASQIDASRGL